MQNRKKHLSEDVLKRLENIREKDTPLVIRIS